MVAVNALANLLPIGGNTTGQVSEAYPNLFTPAPVTFAIWGAFYLLLAVFVLYQWEIFDDGVHSADVRADIGPWFLISCLLNIGWLFSGMEILKMIRYEKIQTEKQKGEAPWK